LSLPGYRMQYAKNGKNFGWKMLAQLPKMRNAIHREHRWLKSIVKTHRPDGIISDNRFGLYHPDIPSVIMTHQLRIMAPFGGIAEDLLQKINYRYIEKFDRAWIVDFKDPAGNLAGKLSHPNQLPSLPLTYLGSLSRFENRKNQKINLKYDLLVLISGPEPQRSKLERLIREQLYHTALQVLIVCGQPNKPREEQLTKNIKLTSHLSAAGLETALLQSKLVLCRPGYTTIMDLVALQKKALFIPTPGQTEQEYLAASLQQKGYFPIFPQKGFDLNVALKTISSFPFFQPSLPKMTQFKEVIKTFLTKL